MAASPEDCTEREQPVTTWIFQANPDHFDIDGYLERDPVRVSWLARQGASEMKVGDQVFIWRAIGSGPAKLSGILAEGFIEEPPLIREDDVESRAFWKSGTPGPEARVRLRLTRIELRQRFERQWLDDDPIMKGSSILTLRAGTNFRLTNEQAVRLNAVWRRAKAPWSYAETVAGLWAYWKTLGGNISKQPNAPVVLAALRTGRVVKGMYNKVLNFRALDPEDPRSGLSATSLMDRDVWSRFYDPVAGKLRWQEIEAEYERLWPSDDLPLPAQPSVDKAVAVRTELSLAELMARFSAKSLGRSSKPRTYQVTSCAFERDPDVIAIARIRAQGRCEARGCAHPLFLDADGQPFLEVHHIDPLSEGGEDRPENVAALCPSHHREVHYGAAATAIRKQLKDLRAAEAAEGLGVAAISSAAETKPLVPS